jgi:hypothetical protein
MRWSEFSAAAPELAALGLDLFDATGLCLLGTLRRDGSPRISPCEPFVVDGELMLGMMWRSKKALDLLRDPRLVVHSPQCDRNGATGDFKLYGRVNEVRSRVPGTDTPIRSRRRSIGGRKIPTTCSPST